jgi:5-methylthioadenosine/S-adenosylhomocysteine deaminase
MTRYQARWVVPVSRPPLTDGVVDVREGDIAYVGRADEAPPLDGELVELGDALLLPGLVNTHTHLELTALRGLLPDAPFRQWIVSLQRTKVGVMTRERYLDAARLGIAEGLLAGVTTYADSCDSGVALEAMRELGVRGIMYQEVFGPDPGDAGRSLGELEAKLERLCGLATDLQRLGVSPHAPYSVSAELYRGVTALARQRGLPMMLHAAESEAESELVESGSGPFADGLRRRGIEVRARQQSPIAWLHQLGVLDERPLLAHCVQVDSADIERIASTGASIAHCPISNAKLGHGVAPVVECRQQGIDVGLGSDSMASNDRMHLLEEARAAVLAQRQRTRRWDALAAQDALELATLGGARALRMGHRIGSLEIGKSADLAAFELGGVDVTPAFDPVAAAVFSLGGSRASFVAVAGRPLVWRGQLTNADPALVARARETAEAIRRWREQAPASR